MGKVTDLRGKTTLAQLAGALSQAKACIAVDSGGLHIAAAVGCPTVALFGNDEDGDVQVQYIYGRQNSLMLS